MPDQPYAQGQPIYNDPRIGTETSTLEPDRDKYKGAGPLPDAPSHQASVLRIEDEQTHVADVPEPSVLALLGLALAALAKRMRR